MNRSSETTKKRIWLFLAIIAGALFLLCVAIVYKDSRAKKYEDVVIYETVGFVSDGAPDETASGVYAHFNDDGDVLFDVFLNWNEKDGIRLVCDRDVSVSLSGVTYRDGDILSVEAFEEIPGEINVDVLGSAAGIFRFVGVHDLPSIHLGTYNEDEDKEYLMQEKGNTASGFCTVIDKYGGENFAGNCSLSIHGNTSWNYDKKSYQINLESDSSILGMGAQRKWLLISEFADISFLKDAIMYKLSADIGDIYSPEFCYVNVYLDGQYEGLYLMTQKIGIDGGTLHELNDLEAANDKMQAMGGTPDVTGGYLAELGVYDTMIDEDPNLIFETPHRWVRIKSPNNATAEQKEYIAAIVNEAEQALYLADGEKNDSGKIWSDYFDTTSWIRQFILQEISVNLDTEYSSEFFYVKENERLLYGGPAWDFDRSLTDYINFIENERLDLAVHSIHNNSISVTEKEPTGILWLKALDSHKDFHEKMKEFYYDVAEPKMKRLLVSDAERWVMDIDHSAGVDAIKNGGYDFTEDDFDDAVATCQKRGKQIIQGFNDRLDFLHGYYRNESDYVTVTFVIPTSRFNLVMPVMPGDTIGTAALPLYHDSMDWYFGDELFTTETLVREDMELTQEKGR